MITALTHLPIYVKNQDEAKEFYISKFGFQLHTDLMIEGMRWLTVCPPNRSFEIVLMLPMSPEHEALVGKQGNQVPVCCLATDNCKADFERMKAAGVTFVKEPTQEMWGTEALFLDLYGNVFDMVEQPSSCC